MKIRPSDVFVPGRFPIEEHNAWADRGDAQRELSKALSRGFVPLVFGPYGVGKSSLTMVCAEDWRAEDRLVYVKSLHGKSLESIFTQILEFLGYEVTTEVVEGNSRSGEGSLGFATEGGVFGVLKAKLTGLVKRGWKKDYNARRELVVQSPTDDKIIELCENGRILLVLDELHRADEKLAIDLAAFLKAVANSNGRDFLVCLLGTSNDASQLVIRDPGIDRALHEIELMSLAAPEARQIIVPGMETLGIQVEEDLVSKIIKAGVGSPFIVQYLCLEMAEAAVSDGRDSLCEGDLENAITDYAKRKAQRAIRAYRAAIETTGPRRYRRQILRAMASMETEYVTMEELVAKVTEQVGDAVPSTALSGPLRALKSAEFGSILSDVTHLSSGERVPNYSTFTDPAMKSIVRMIEELDLDSMLSDETP